MNRIEPDASRERLAFLWKLKSRGTLFVAGLQFGWPRHVPATFVVSLLLLYGLSFTLAEGQTVTSDPAGAPEEGRQAVIQADATGSTNAEDGTSPLDIGDHIKIKIYGREDLSGEYRVSEQGKIRIPALGSFDAVANTSAQLENAISAALEQLKRPGDVSIDVVERRPVYVTGLVAKPGAYPFSPGMAVIHATALAGGTSASAMRSALQTEALREASHIRSARDEIKRSLARQARLIAERDGSDYIAVPPQLVELAGEKRAAQYVQDEREILIRQREMMARQKEALDSAIKEGKIEVGAYESELSNLGEQKRLRQTTLESVKTLSVKGLTTQQRLIDSQLLLTSVDRDSQYAIANIARSRQTVQRAEHDLTMLALERNIAIEKELQGIDEQLAKSHETIEVADKVITHVAGLPSRLLTQEREPEYGFEIMRKAADGQLRRIKATETTALRPGDVLSINSEQTE